jgi:glycosyltransferase involved in cell wall biosynthesis
MREKLMVLTTHPIQYITPWYKELQVSLECDFKVLFLNEPLPKDQGIGFGLEFEWDLPLRSGYCNDVICPKGHKLNLIHLCFKLLKYLKKEKPSILLVTGWNHPALIFAIFLSKILRIKLLIRGESNDLRKRSFVKKIFHKVILSRADGFLKIGTANERFYLKNGIQSNQIFDGCYFVNNKSLQNSIDTHSNKILLRTSLGIDSNDLVLLFVGKFVEFKQPLLLIKAAAEVKKIHKNISVLFVGSGELEYKMNSLAEQLNISVYFTGFLNQNELWKGYLMADIFVLPSNSEETWGLVTNEAMLFGLPVLVSNQIGSAEDLVYSSKMGRVFNPNKNDLTETILEFITDPNNLEFPNLDCQNHILNYYSMQRATEGLKKAISQLL